MKLLMSVFMIRFIMALFDNKAKGNKQNGQKNIDGVDTRHPASFQVLLEVIIDKVVLKGGE